jgi:hypothetical protein
MVTVERFPELHAERSARRARAAVNGISGGARRASGKIGMALDMAWTLLVLTFVGMGIVVLRFLLALARGVIGH